MPIYAYKCSSCGFAKDVLQKMSDAPLTVCPECGKDTFCKQLTAAGFQLKGSGWYVTDFREGNKGGAGKEKPAAADSGADKPAGATDSPAPAPAATAPSGPPSSGGGSGADS